MVLNDLCFLLNTVVCILCWNLRHQIQRAQRGHKGLDMFFVHVLIVEQFDLKTIDTGFVERINQSVQRILLNINITQNDLFHESVQIAQL